VQVRLLSLSVLSLLAFDIEPAAFAREHPEKPTEQTRLTRETARSPFTVKRVRRATKGGWNAREGTRGHASVEVLTAQGRVLARLRSTAKNPAQGAHPHIDELTHQGSTLLRVRLPTAQPNQYEVWLLRGSAVVWHGLSGALDQDAESVSELRVEGGTLSRVSFHRTARDCKGHPLPLNRQTLDLKKRRFMAAPQPSAANASEAPPRRAKARALADEDLIPQGAQRHSPFQITSTSLTASVVDELHAGTTLSPLLSDRRLSPAWKLPTSRAGHPATLIARGSGSFAPQEVHIWFPPQTRLPHSISVRSDIDGPGLSVDLPTHDMPGASANGVSIPLPPGFSKSCLEIRLEPHAGQALALSEVDIRTALDSDEGPSLLAEQIAHGRRCSAHLSRLAFFPAQEMVSQVLQAGHSLGQRGARCQLRALSELSQATPNPLESLQGRDSRRLAGLLALKASQVQHKIVERWQSELAEKLSPDTAIELLSNALGATTSPEQQAASMRWLLVAVARNPRLPTEAFIEQLLQTALATKWPGGSELQRNYLNLVARTLPLDTLSTLFLTAEPSNSALFAHALGLRGQMEPKKAAQAAQILAAAWPSELPKREPPPPSSSDRPGTARVTSEISTSKSDGTSAQENALYVPKVRLLHAIGLLLPAEGLAFTTAVASQDPDPAVRANALRVLGRTRASNKGLTKSLCTALTDPDPGVRAEAARGLHRQGRWWFKEVGRTLQRSDTPALKSAAIGCEGRQILEAAKVETWPFAKHRFLEALAEACPPALEAFLVETLRLADLESRVGALHVARTCEIPSTPRLALAVFSKTSWPLELRHAGIRTLLEWPAERPLSKTQTDKLLSTTDAVLGSLSQKPEGWHLALTGLATIAKHAPRSLAPLLQVAEMRAAETAEPLREFARRTLRSLRAQLTEKAKPNPNHKIPNNV